MGDNFQIKPEDLRMANLQLLKETLAYNMVLVEIIAPIYCHIKNIKASEADAHFEKVYKEKLELIDNYIKAEYGHLDIEALITSKKDDSIEK